MRFRAWNLSLLVQKTDSISRYSDDLVRHATLVQLAAPPTPEIDTKVQSVLVKRKRDDPDFLPLRTQPRPKVDLPQPLPHEFSPPRAIEGIPKGVSSLWSRSYIGPVLELALSVSLWSAVRMMVEASFGCTITSLFLATCRH